MNHCITFSMMKTSFLVLVDFPEGKTNFCHFRAVARIGFDGASLMVGWKLGVKIDVLNYM